MHDGVKFPRAVRKAGLRTDLFDGTDLVSCRMYRGFGQTWRGFAKNAYEGLGSFALLAFITVYHGLGQMLPWVALALALVSGVWTLGATLFVAAIACALVLRLLLASRFRQSFWNIALHPVSMLMLSAVQWRSLWLQRTGRRGWKGRIAGT